MEHIDFKSNAISLDAFYDKGAARLLKIWGVPLSSDIPIQTRSLAACDQDWDRMY